MIFKKKIEATKQKLRGGYYTPAALSSYITQWAIDESTKHVLEPSCGDGNFLESIQSLSDDNRYNVKVSAVEIDGEEINKAKDRISTLNVEWHNNDFFQSFSTFEKKSFDAVLGNPPFIRFQHFDDESRERAFDHLRAYDYKPTKLANAWAAFVQLSIELLKDGGKLGMVVPAELLQVKYASELRERIVKHFDHVVLVGFKKLVFPSIQQEVVLLLAEGKHSKEGSTCDVHTIQVKNESELSIQLLQNTIAHTEAKHTHPGMKWTSFFLSEEQFNYLDGTNKNKKISILGDLASIDVGIVTGRNSFFVVSKENYDKYDLKDYCSPLVGKTSAINKIVFDKEKFELTKNLGNHYLLDLKGVPDTEFSKGLWAYINLGEAEDVHLGYKCRVRKRWYEVPSTHMSDGFLFRQIHKYPLLVSNDVQALCTDTIHRVKLIRNIDMQQLSASFVNSMTFAWSEVCGRSYGGGVLELETREAEELPIPFDTDTTLDVTLVDKFLAEGKIVEALNYVDEQLLVNYLGLSWDEVYLLRSCWETLRDRRINRK